MSQRTRGVILALGLVLLLYAGLDYGARRLASPPASPPPGVTMTDLQGIDDLQTQFNTDQGATRLILLLSPT